jgi:hypothetical protein
VHIPTLEDELQQIVADADGVIEWATHVKQQVGAALARLRGQKSPAVPVSSAGIEITLRHMVELAKRDARTSVSQKVVRELAVGKSTVEDKVQAVVNMIKDRFVDSPGAVVDADDAVSMAAAGCMILGIPCRVVGARFGQSWTSWLSYHDEATWVDVDVLGGRRPDREPDQRIELAAWWPGADQGEGENR